MARQVTQRTQVPGIRVIDTDVGAQQLSAAITQTAANFGGFAKQAIANQRKEEAIAAARAATLERAPNGDLIAPAKTADTAIPSIYSATYDAVMQKRYLNEMGLAAGEEFARLHNDHKFDPDGFRLSADSYIKRITESVPDWAFEATSLTLKTYASQHYTNIANQTQEAEWQDAQKYTLETLELLINDLARNARNESDPDARAAQHDVTMGLILGELSFAEDEKLLRPEVIQRVRDLAQRSAVMGSVARSARSVLRQADTSADVDTMAAVATERAFQNIPKEVYDFMGSEAEARQWIENTIKFEANDIKIELAYQEFLEDQRFRGVLAEHAQAMYDAAVSGNDNDMFKEMYFRDPGDWKNSRYKDFAARMARESRQGILALDQLATVSGAYSIQIQQEFAKNPSLVIGLAKELGLPIGDDGKPIFDERYVQSADGLQNAIVKQQALLRAIPNLSGKMSEQDKAVLSYYATAAELTRSVTEERGQDMGQLLQRSAEGDAEADKEISEIMRIVNAELPNENWKPAQLQMADEAFLRLVAPEAAAAGLGQNPYMFDQWIKSSPRIAKDMIEWTSMTQTITGSQLQTLGDAATGLIYGSDDQLPDPQQLGAAMMLYSRMRQDSHLRSFIKDIPEGERFEQLYVRGARGSWDPQGGFSVNMPPARMRQIAREPLPSEAESMLKQRGDLLKEAELGDLLDPWGPGDDRDNMPAGMVEDLLRRSAVDAAREGVSQTDVIRRYRRNNFWEIDYGKTWFVRGANSANATQPIVKFAPTALLTDGEQAVRWRELDRRLNEVVEERYGDRVERGKGGVVNKDYTYYVDGVIPTTARYNGKGRVKEQTMMGTLWIEYADGKADPLHDQYGQLISVELNDLVLDAHGRMIDTDAEAIRNIRQATQFEFGVPR